MANAAIALFIITFFEIVFLILAIGLTGWSGLAARRAADAANEANRITREEQRAWLKMEIMETNVQYAETGWTQCIIQFSVNNIGKTPARNVQVSLETRTSNNNLLETKEKSAYLFKIHRERNEDTSGIEWVNTVLLPDDTLHSSAILKVDQILSLSDPHASVRHFDLYASVTYEPIREATRAQTAFVAGLTVENEDGSLKPGAPISAREKVSAVKIQRFPATAIVS